MSRPTAMRTIFTRERVGALLTLGMAEFVRGSLLFFILPIYIRGVLGFSASIVGYAMAAHYAFDTSLRGPSGWLADRFGQRNVAISALGVGWLGLFILTRVHTDWTIVTGCALLGIGMAAIWPCVVSRVTSGLPQEGHATAMSGVMMSWLAGVGLGTVTMSFTLGKHVGSGFAALQLIWLGALALSTVSMLGYRSEDHHRKRLGFRTLVHEIRTVKVILPGIFIQTFVMGILMPVFVLYTQYQLGLTGRIYSALLITGGAAAVLLQLPIGRLVDRKGFKPFLLTGLGLCAVLLTFLVHVHQVWILFATIAGIGACYALILPSWNAVVAHSVRPKQKTLMWGVFMTVEGLGMAIGPLIGSRLWQAFHPSTPFFVAGLVLVLMMLFYGLVPVEHAFVAGDDAVESPQEG